jgi:hypothetical protein
MSITLSYTQAVELAELAVENVGADHVYRRALFLTTDVPQLGGNKFCAYFTPLGEPSCIVGHILHHLGVVMDSRSMENFTGIMVLIEQGFVVADHQTKLFLTELQNLQDVGTPWGKALERAKAHTEALTPELPQVPDAKFYASELLAAPMTLSVTA